MVNSHLSKKQRSLRAASVFLLVIFGFSGVAGLGAFSLGSSKSSSSTTVPGDNYKGKLNQNPQLAVASAYNSTKSGTAAFVSSTVGINLTGLSFSNGGNSKYLAVFTSAGTFDFKNSNGNFAISTQGQSSNSNFNIVNELNKTYISIVPGSIGNSAQNKSWTEITLQDLENPANSGGLSTIYEMLGNPSIAAQLLDYITPEPNLVNSGISNGVDISEYKADLNVAQASQAINNNPLLLSIVNQITNKTFQIAVELDNTGRIRGINFSITLATSKSNGSSSTTKPLSAGGLNIGLQLTYLLEVTEYGAIVKITSPPDSEVLDWTSYSKLLQSTKSTTTT